MPTTKLQWLEFFIYMSFEFFIGKSKKYESASLLELIINLLTRRKL